MLIPTTGVLSEKMALDLSECRSSISGQGARHIASYLQQSPAIGKLVLHNMCNLQSGDDEDGLLYIAEALQTNSSLTKLGLLYTKLQHTKQNGSALTKM